MAANLKPLPPRSSSIAGQGAINNPLILREIVECSVRAFGSSLDEGVYPQVLDGGILTPGCPVIPVISPGAEISHEPRSWSAQSSSPALARSVGTAASLERSNLPEAILDEIAAIERAYPGSRVWREPDGFWTLSPSQIIDGLAHPAAFLLAVSWAERAVRAWGVWQDSAVTVRWIGPRHTNFPDGSICAFDPVDGSWQFGDSLVTLLDLCTVWAFRHLHLDWAGRWPGEQSVAHPFERLREFKGDEHCGCGSNARYGECCFPRDAVLDPLKVFVAFSMNTCGGLRAPPQEVIQVMSGGRRPPPLHTIRWFT